MLASFRQASRRGLQRGDDHLIRVPEQHVGEREACALEQTGPAGYGHAIVSDTIGMARTQELCVVIAKKPVSRRPEPFPILARVSRRLLGLPLLEPGRKRNLGRGGFGEYEYPASAQECVNVSGQLLRTRDLEPMKSIDCHDGVVVAGQNVLPAMSPQVGNNNLAENLIPPIDASADRREERVFFYEVEI